MTSLVLTPHVVLTSSKGGGGGKILARGANARWFTTQWAEWHS